MEKSLNRVNEALDKYQIEKVVCSTVSEFIVHEIFDNDPHIDSNQLFLCNYLLLSVGYGNIRQEEVR